MDTDFRVFYSSIMRCLGSKSNTRPTKFPPCFPSPLPYLELSYWRPNSGNEITSPPNVFLFFSLAPSSGEDFRLPAAQGATRKARRKPAGPGRAAPPTQRAGTRPHQPVNSHRSGSRSGVQYPPHTHFKVLFMSLYSFRIDEFK